MSQRLEISCKACFYLYLTSCLDALLVLPSCKSGSWRRYTCTNVLLVYKGEVRELVQSGGMGGLLWSFIYGTSGSTELCMVPYCHMSYLWDLDKAGVEMCRECFKLGWRCNLQRGDSFYREGRFSLCNTAVLWNFIASLTGYML